MTFFMPGLKPVVEYGRTIIYSVRIAQLVSVLVYYILCNKYVQEYNLNY